MMILASSMVSSSNSRVYDQTLINDRNGYLNHTFQIIEHKAQFPYGLDLNSSNLGQGIEYKDLIKLSELRAISKTNKCLGSQQINVLPHKSLRKPINIIVESDEVGYISRVIDLPLYAIGNDAYESIQNLRIEIETLYYELMEDDQFSEEWLNYKKYLQDIIID